MAKGIYVQRGETIDFVNSTNAVISAGDIVELEGRIGIAATEIPVGVKGALNVMGVYDLPASTSESFGVGALVHFKDGEIQSGDEDAVPAGWVVEPKTTSGAVARVKIG